MRRFNWLKKSADAKKKTPFNITPKAKLNVKKGKAKVRSPMYPATFKVIVGTYEKLLYGLEGSFIDEDGNISKKLHLKPVFIFPAHVSCIKAVAASPDGGKWLATGSTDEIIKVWDLRRRSITGLSFPTRSYLFSTSEDGTICVFRARDWTLLRSLKGHKGSVNSVAVHPSGKVGLSVGKDRTLRMWDLMRGKGSASTKLGKEGELVRWSSKGDRFIVQSGSIIDVYSTDMALLLTFTHPSRVQDVRFCSNVAPNNECEFLLVAAEDKKVTIYSTTSKDSTSLPVIAEVIGHQNRVKAMDILSIAITSFHSWTTILCTVSSDGWIRIFDLGALVSPDNKDKNKMLTTLEAIAEYDTKGSRLTCCALADGDANIEDITGKRKHGDIDSDGDEDNESYVEKNEAQKDEGDGASDHSEDEEDESKK
ncbi:hypothetical protein EW145_g254 [Phellinidium pouzarii]|uniref:Uncharacterized protein n=1 Tax=Phellinidium pouzarii TaxID=167371 RepID=A0A4S4LJ47_9AGAM|nr:hypothetical protein EW145_g254 [Phellinidium pouzarii]